MALLLTASLLLGPGVLAAADPGVLEAVAERRTANGWGLAVGQEWQGYDVLLAVEDCEWLGREVTLVTHHARYRALVVDCESSEHSGMMRARGIVADTNMVSLNHQKAVILWRE